MAKIAKPAAVQADPLDYVSLAKARGLDALNYSFKDACKHLACRASYGWQLIRDGRLQAVYVDERCLVPATAIIKYLIEREGQQPPKRVRKPKAFSK
jgi:hypothetical protein